MFALLDVAPSTSRVHASRRVFDILVGAGCETPVIHHRVFDKGASRDEIVIAAGTELGALLVDGLGDGAMLECEGEVRGFCLWAG